MTAAFHREHQARFGFADPGRTLVCAALETETVAGGGEPQAVPPGARHPASRSHCGRSSCAARGTHPDLPAGKPVRRAGRQRPALIVEAGSTTVVEAGWRAEMTARGDLLLTALDLPGQRPDCRRPDPTWLTLFNRRFMSLAEDMGRTLQNTARSVNIRERLDFSCALFNAAGDLIANAPHIPVHLAAWAIR